MDFVTESANSDTRKNILSKIPQKPPFRFIDEILELSADHVLGSYRFRDDEFFYAGHFEGNPVTPGVILIETMAQIGCVPLVIFLSGNPDPMTIFTSAEAEFLSIVHPGETVFVRSEKIYYRMNCIKVRARMTREGGEIICNGILTGKLGVIK